MRSSFAAAATAATAAVVHTKRFAYLLLLLKAMFGLFARCRRWYLSSRFAGRREHDFSILISIVA